MVRIYMIGFILLATMCTGCENGHLNLTEKDTGKTITLSVGQDFTVTLPGNPTTGYTWKLNAAKTNGVSQVKKLNYIGDSDSKLVGSGGSFTFTFKVTAKGKNRITLEYLRPWEKGVPAAKTFEINIDGV
ncbi:MAG: protease inhibitor I42 family protein [Candidatus Ancaeobacter aquaticus]|nr:protease inhibitor I42 family protein [Candidatus Ancaeobacter aquaticus]